MDVYILLITAVVLFCIVVIQLISGRKMKRLLKRKNGEKETASGVLEDVLANAKDKELIDLKDRVCELLQREKLYRNPKIRVADIAERLGTNKSYLAQAIRLKTNKNFCQLIHSYRVKEAVRLFEEDSSLSIGQLSRMVGFNSMTTFNSAFSRNTGCTPAEWCREFRKKNSNGKK